MAGEPVRVELPSGDIAEFAADVTPEEIRATVKQLSDPTIIGSFGRSVKRGAAVGLADEVGGFGEAVGRQLRNLTAGEDNRFGEDYERALARNRGQQDADRSVAGGVPAIAGEVLGGFASAVPGGGLKAAMAGQSVPRATVIGGQAAPQGTIASRAGQAGAVGAASGGAVGFAEGEGGFGKRTDNAALGGALGGAFGMGLSSLIDVAPRLARVVFGPSTKSLNAHSASALMSAFEADGIPRGKALSLIDKWRQGGSDPELIADLGGPAVRRLARAARSASPKASSLADTNLLGRHLEQGSRITAATRKATGNRGDAFYQTIDDLATQRSAKARPLYEAAWDEPVWGDWFAKATKNPRIKRALEMGKEALEDESLALGVDPPEIRVFTDFGPDSGGLLNRVPTVKEWDAVKRGLDKIIQNGRDPVTGRLNGDAMQADMLRRKLLSELDRVPKYAEARAAWAGPSEAIDLATKGRKIFSKDPEVIAREIGGIRNPDNVEVYRLGVARALEDMLDTVRESADATLRFNNKRWKQIEAALGPDATRELRSAIDREINMAKTLNVVARGSQTQDKMSDALMLERGPDTAALRDLMTGNVKGSMARAALEATGRRLQGVNEKVGSKLGDWMFTPSAAGPSASAEVRAASRAELDAAIRRMLLERQVGAAAGRSAGMLTGP